MGAPVLIGAGIGALGSTLMGGSPFKGALLGGVGGGLGGALMGGGAGAWTGGGAQALSAAPAGVGISLAPAAATDTALSLAPTVSSAVPTGLGIDLAAAPASAGISNLGAYATGAGTNLMAANPTLWDKIKPYANIQNLSGASNLMQQFQPKPMQIQASGGGINRGQAPQGTDVLSLIKATQIPERKRITLL